MVVVAMAQVEWVGVTLVAETDAVIKVVVVAAAAVVVEVAIR